MKKIFPVCIMLIALLLLACCVSCKSTEPEGIYVKPDIEEPVTMLFDTRPNDEEEMMIIPHEAVKTTLQLMWNGNEYQLAWERWKNYAIGLEDFLNGLVAEFKY